MNMYKRFEFLWNVLNVILQPYFYGLTGNKDYVHLK